MYKIIEIILKTDEDTDKLKAEIEKLDVEITSFNPGPEIFERVIDGKTFTHVCREDERDDIKENLR